MTLRAAMILLLLAASRPAAGGAFVPVGVHPDAAAQPTATGRIIATLKPWQGRLWAGFGDYTANTGPIGIRAFDPLTQTFSAISFQSGTEATYLYREIGGALYAPHIDPVAGESSGGFARAFAAAPDTWRDTMPVTAVHLYDTFTLDGTDRWLVGSRGNDATAWRSLDGAAWVNVPEIAVPPTAPATFTRFYFGIVRSGQVHVQAASSSRSKVFDGTNWSDGPDLLPGAAYGWHVEDFAGRSVYQGSHAGIGFSRLIGFDGLVAAELGVLAYDYAIADGNLWALVVRFTPVPGTSGGGTWALDGVYQTADLCTWTRVASAPPELRSIAIDGGRMHAGALDAALFEYDTTVAPIALGPPPEVTDLRVARQASDVVLTWTPATIGSCVQNVVLTCDSWPVGDPACWTETGLAAGGTTWRHVAAATDGIALRSYLVVARTPAGDGPWGALGR